MKRDKNAMRIALIAGLCGFSAVALSQAAQANEPVPDPATATSQTDPRTQQTRAHFDRLDRNKDGRLSQAELDGDDQRFLDADATGYRIELAGLDSNSDGVISRDEWNAKYYDLQGSKYDDKFRDNNRERRNDPPRNPR